MQPVANNRLRLLKNGAEFFPALIESIDAARHQVQLETYIFTDDSAGQRVAAALIGAARRGVRVRVLIDGVGSRETPLDFLTAMRESGIELAIFRPERAIFRLSRQRLRRNHRKLVLIDDTIGLVGGINIIDDFTDNLSDAVPRFDYAVMVEGPLVKQIAEAMLRLWRVVTRWRRSLAVGAAMSHSAAPSAVGTSSAALVVRDNLRYRRAIEAEYFTAIRNARRTILLMSPYFLPGRKFRAALQAASHRGVRVTILLQGRADHPLLQWATHAFYEKFLAHGVQIYEYDAAMLHGKVAVVDDLWATVGSSNLDPFSLLLNREANVITLDADFAIALRKSVEAEIAAHARAIVVSDWNARSWWWRIRASVAMGIARLVGGFIGSDRR